MQTLSIRCYAGETDLPAIVELLNTCDAVDQLDDNYAINDLRMEFDDPNTDQARDLRLWEDNGRLIGFGQTWINFDREVVDGYLFFRVHPGARNAGIEEEIFAWGCDRLREAGSERGWEVILRSGSHENDAARQEFLARQGMTASRYFFRMKRSLNEPIPEPQLPPGFTLRHVVGDEDVAPWVELFNQSFIDHWNHQELAVDAHRHWLTDPNYRPERDLIAIAPDGTFAAFCFCHIDPADNQRNNRNEGWISQLGTRRGFRRMGLGRAMLLIGLQRLKAEGVEIAKLGVDAENPTGALRLYESVGFYRTTTRILYSISL